VTDLLNAIPRNLILPPGSLFLLIALGLLARRRWPRAGGAVAGSALVLLAFLSSNAGAEFLVAPLDRMTTPLHSPETSGAQAIVVLAAGRLQEAPEYGGRDIPDYIALARLRYAAHLQRRTGLPILVSGGNPDEPYTLADAMATALRDDFGVPVRWVEKRSRNTAENAALTTAMLRADGIAHVLLVTDAMHMERARTVFQRHGLQVTDAPTMFFGNQARSLWAWVPSAEGMRRSWYATYELIGIAWYRLHTAEQIADTGTRVVSDAERSGRIFHDKVIARWNTRPAEFYLDMDDLCRESFLAKSLPEANTMMRAAGQRFDLTRSVQAAALVPPGTTPFAGGFGLHSSFISSAGFNVMFYVAQVGPPGHFIVKDVSCGIRQVSL